MDFKTLRSQFSDSNWLSIASELIQHQESISLSQKESRALLEAARIAISDNDALSAQNALYAGLLFDEERFLIGIQKQGILRISRLSYVAEPLTTIAKALLVPDLGLSDVVVAYLTSLTNLYSVAADVRSLYVILRDWLRDERERGIKSSLAWLDFTFLEYNVGIREPRKDGRQSDDPNFFEIEELAEGFSTILAIYGQEIGELSVNTAINEEGLLDGRYATFVNMAAHISAFREWEFCIDRQGFTLISTDDPSEWRLCHTSQDFHRAIEFGFIQSFQQRMIGAYTARESGGTSIHSIGHSLMPMLQDKGYIKIADSPVRRVRVEVPEGLLTKITEQQGLLLEEMQALGNASSDLLTSVEDILKFEVQEGLSFHDIFLVARAIDLVRSIAAARLIPEIEQDPGLVFQSIVTVFEVDKLIELLSTCVSREVAEKAVAMWTTDIMGHVDIQYRPLIPAGSTLLFPMNIFGASNSFRNPLQILQKRLYEDGTDDPLSRLIVKLFKDKGYQAESSFDYSGGEIDVLTLVDGVLFAFECKNSLLPTGSHELMTSLDYIRTASEQLDRFTENFADMDFRNWISEATGWPINRDTRLSTGIILSNRMFMGCREYGHPVRNPYELEHFVNAGTFRMDEESVCLWIGDQFTGEDLRRYLEEDITYKPQWESLEQWQATYKFPNCTVLVDRLRMNAMTLAQQFGFEKAIEGMIEQHEHRQGTLDQYSFPAFYESKISDLKEMSQDNDQ